ncbi:alpha/beta hydrolase [Granulicella rosea]|nr:alpha/beta hydrolase [Granulicella rosea]
MATQKTKKPQSNVRIQTADPEVVDPMWLLKAAAIMVAVGLLCGYGTLCYLVYQGQWQLVLHPDATHPKAVATATLPLQPIAFGATESGQPRLNGWWIPGDGNHAETTVLYLHDGSGNLDRQIAPLEALHAAGLSVFAFDYRGFGASESTHPTQQLMTEDSAAALDYLLNTRHLPAKTIVPYGAGLGAALAVQLAVAHPELPALIVESPNPDLLALARKDPRAGMVPLNSLFHERFELTALQSLKTPKLLLAGGPSPVVTPPDAQSLATLFHQAATPSFIVSGALTGPAFPQTIQRFLDEYLPAGPSQLTHQ